MCKAALLCAAVLAVSVLPAQADDFDARWKAVSDGVETCWDFGKAHDDGTVTYPEPYRAVCNELADLQASMHRTYLDRQSRLWLDHLKDDLRKAEGK